VTPSVTIAEAARRLGVSTKTIRRRIARGDLAALHDGTAYRVTDPRATIVGEGQPSLDNWDNRDTPAKRDGTMGTAVLELSRRLVDAEVRAARAEWELAQLRRALPAPEPPRPWWAFWR
jgi:excisionase family DNA binding protein